MTGSLAHKYNQAHQQYASSSFTSPTASFYVVTGSVSSWGVLTGNVGTISGISTISAGSGYATYTTDFQHGYEKGILDYINGIVDDRIIPKERLRKLKIGKL
jgi:hypothetical protein